MKTEKDAIKKRNKLYIENGISIVSEKLLILNGK
jgi:hypothetical protein